MWHRADDLVSKGVCSEHGGGGGAEFKSSQKKPDVVAHICNPCTGEHRDRWVPGALRLAVILAKLVSWFRE